MRHRKVRLTLGITKDHREALLANLSQALIKSKRIRTTHLNAKAASRFIEKMITIAKKQTLAARRQLIAEIGSQEVAKTLVELIAPAFKNRHGGYTRILKADFRPGDGAQMAYLEFTEEFETAKKKGGKKKVKKEKAPKVEEAEGEAKDKKEAEKKEDDSKKDKKSSGFLGSLRGFLKGE